MQCMSSEKAAWTLKYRIQWFLVNVYVVNHNSICFLRAHSISWCWHPFLFYFPLSVFNLFPILIWEKQCFQNYMYRLTLAIRYISRCGFAWSDSTHLQWDGSSQKSCPRHPKWCTSLISPSVYVSACFSILSSIWKSMIFKIFITV